MKCLVSQVLNFSWDLCYWVAAWHMSLTVSLLQWISITNCWTQQAQETEMDRPAYLSQLSPTLLIAAIFSCPIRQLCYNNPQCRYQARELRRRGLSEDKETCPWYDQRPCDPWVCSVGLCGAICQVTFSVMKSTGDEYFTEVRNLAFLVQFLSMMLIINDIQKKKERKDE